MPADATGTVVERTFRFGRHETLAGVLTSGRGGISRVPVVILGAGIIHKVGPSRISVELARDLAAVGHPVLRFDLSGIGDSPRSPGASLEAMVKADIDDAITLILEQAEGNGGVCLVGFCSGADNGLYMAALDERVLGVVMFDPTVHETPGYRRRQLVQRLTSRDSWINIFSGRSLWLRSGWGRKSEDGPPPSYYGLLAGDPSQTDRRAAAAVARGVRFLVCLSSGSHAFCNAPEQVRESLPHGFSEEHFTVKWLPHLDHILSGEEQRKEFIGLVREWSEKF